MVNINQKGVFFMSQAVARQMVKQRAGVIVNVSSESGLEGSEGQSCYAATKAALNSFTRSWSKNWVNMGSAWSALRRGSSKKPVCGHRNMKRRWPGRAISPSSNFARDIPKTPFPSGGQENSQKSLILFAYLLSARAQLHHRSHH
ncbi:Sorbitol-6-phosphate 2-dehydrogenase [Klebsiella pneumoniae subsp. ozaenae]|uniref:Sorbitol-6-phosphate 2-dehydrogenase n=1 Tax=Klebsiella pneumoniae subsp. ozaenae TaxID=574 RepID=A0A378AWN3_KLEPO|nr:Sorbitol-6-phosphate 2-dehydrogenase [Klebsiella pneumoniae subsp. ozaenae]